MLKQLLRNVLMVALLTLICSFYSAAQAAPGDLDTTFAGFGMGGVVSAPQLNSRGMELQPDGKIVIVGHAGNGAMAVLRYLPNGQPDNSFGNNGRTTIPAPVGINIQPQDVGVQTDGKIVVAGYNTNTEFDRGAKFLLIRLTASGQLDASFGDQGFVLTDFSNGSDVARTVLIQPDGRIVAAGSAHKDNSNFVDFAVARYTTGGLPDPTFGGGDGKVTIAFDDPGFQYVNDIALQTDGKLVVVGTSFIGNDFDFAIARLEINGSLDKNDNDSGFSGDGKLTMGFGADEEAMAVAVQADGKIVVVGRANFNAPDNSFITRYLPNGNLDGTFGSGGKKTIPNDRLNNLSLSADGKMMLLGYTSQDDKFAFHRLLSSGTHDPTLGVGGDGIVWLDLDTKSEHDTDLALLPDGRILGTGSNNSQAVLLRLWPDGTFDAGGKQTHSLAFPPVYPPGSDATTSALAVQADGKLLVAGQLRNPSGSSSDTFITRFLSDGRLDTSFGNQGTARSGEPFTSSVARALALQPDGKIVIAGYKVYSGGWVEFLVARFHPTGAPDTTFGLNGSNYRLANFSNGASEDMGTALALAPDGKIVVAGNVWNGSRQIWGVARWNSSGTPDTSFSDDGKAFVDFNGTNTAKAVVVQPDGKIIIGGDYAGDFFLQRLLENGLPDPSFGINGGGYNITNMGGTDSITALALAPNGWLYAAGYSWRGGADDFTLAQYTPEGVLASCPAGQSCDYWPQGKRFVSLGGSDSAYALVLRGDNQLVAGGCADSQMAAVQVSIRDVNATPLLFRTDFVGHFDCAFGVQFSNASKNKIVLAGLQAYNSDSSIALARFETTLDNTAPPPPPTSTSSPIYLPIIVK